MAAAVHNNKSSVWFNTLNEFQNEETIAKIFSHGINNLKGSNPPVFILLVGSPSVGKTTQISRLLKDNTFNDHYRMKFNKKVTDHNIFEYDNFYKVSLDSVVEHIRPYREVTSRLYNKLRNTRKNTKICNRIYKEDLTPEDYQLLSEVYLSTVQSQMQNFGLEEREKAIITKILRTYSEKNSITNKKNTPVKKRRSTAMSPSKCNRNTNAIKDINKSLLECVKMGIEYGIRNKLNIVYDCTITPQNTRLEKYLPLLNEHNYNIIVMLVDAPHDIIIERLKGRHNKMIRNNNYIRAIPPKLIKKFIEQNRMGYDALKNTYDTDENIMFHLQPN
jgi:GTPase SAR1 family protein